MDDDPPAAGLRKAIALDGMRPTYQGSAGAPRRQRGLRFALFAGAVRRRGDCGLPSGPLTGLCFSVAPGRSQLGRVQRPVRRQRDRRLVIINATSVSNFEVLIWVGPAV